MLQLLRQRRWLGFSAFVLLMLALCLVLSRWQWNRYQQRQAENARLDAAISAPATPVDSLLRPGPAGAAQGPTPDQVWRAVTATGTFDVAQQVAVRRRPLDGRNGFWIVTPLVTDSGVLLVNRGWVPASGGDATTTPAVEPPPSGTVTVTGRLRAPERDTSTDAAPPGQAWALDPDRVVSPSAAPRYAGYLELRDSPDAAAGLVELADPGHRGLNNLVYTVQWILFAVVGAFGWWRLMRTEASRDARDGMEDQAPAPDRTGSG